MDILLIRHGQTDWNIEGRLQGSTDIPLNQEGLMQAELCAQFLKTVNLTTLISSPLSRAKQTAELIASTCHLPIVEMAAFREKSYGDAEGLAHFERQEKFRTRPFPKEELFENLITRVFEGLNEITQKYSNQKIAIVTHGGVINCILHVISNGEIGTNKTILHNASISTIRFENNQFLVVDANNIAYLATV